MQTLFNIHTKDDLEDLAWLTEMTVVALLSKLFSEEIAVPGKIEYSHRPDVRFVSTDGKVIISLDTIGSGTPFIECLHKKALKYKLDQTIGFIYES